MTPLELQALIFDALGKIAVRQNEEAALEGTTVEDVTVERPKDREHGDWATNIALKFGKRLGLSNPRELAQLVAAELEQVDGIDKVEIAGPGFVNVFLAADSLAGVLLNVLDKGEEFGNGDQFATTGEGGKPERINLEFVSANPTGPIHSGGTRWAAVGDSLARILESQGATVEREYYFNDHGSQIDKFAASLLAGAFGLEVPEEGYAGSYIAEIAAEVLSAHPEITLPDGFAQPNPATITAYKEAAPEAIEALREYGVQLMFPLIKQSLEDFRVEFDTYFHEQSLYDDGKVQKAIDRLTELGVIYEKDGATWLETTKFGDDKDRVIIKSDGEEAYIAADIAYYLDKRTRADKAIYILGADHSGYVGRLNAVAQAFGDKVPDNMQVMIGQLVNLKKDGEPVKMSKRDGNIVTMEELVGMVGVDAARYSLVRSSIDSTLEIDLNLITSHSNENPVYYVQYAYARTRNVWRNVETLAPTVASAVTDAPKTADLSLLTDPTENELIAKITQFPEVVAYAASSLEPHRVARYLEELAAAYHKWYAACRVLSTEGVPESLSLARTVLNEATGITLRNGLGLLGVTAPEKM